MIIVFLGTTLWGCVHGRFQPSRKNQFSASAQKEVQAAQNEKVNLRFQGRVGEDVVTRYYSSSLIHDYEEAQMVRARDENVEFKVREKVQSIHPQTGLIQLITSTIFKDGTVDLHDLGFPEKGEDIEYQLNAKGEVFKAGDYPPDSIFFVPQLPLPDGPVGLGDTWTLNRAWMGLKNGVPLELQVVGILKNIVTCPSGRCADLEISGQVEIIGLNTKQTNFTSSIWGRMLMSVEHGYVLWSEIRSQEHVAGPGFRSEVLSCMVSALEEPQAGQWLPAQKATCQPTEDPLHGVIGL